MITINPEFLFLSSFNTNFPGLRPEQKMEIAGLFYRCMEENMYGQEADLEFALRGRAAFWQPAPAEEETAPAPAQRPKRRRVEANSPFNGSNISNGFSQDGKNEFMAVISRGGRIQDIAERLSQKYQTRITSDMVIEAFNQSGPEQINPATTWNQLCALASSQFDLPFEVLEEEERTEILRDRPLPARVQDLIIERKLFCLYCKDVVEALREAGITCKGTNVFSASYQQTGVNNGKNWPAKEYKKGKITEEDARLRVMTKFQRV